MRRSGVRFISPAPFGEVHSMTRRFALLAIISLLLAKPACADPFDDALAAFAREDYATAFPLFQKLAEKGAADAQTNLGLMYEHGHGVAQDHKQAVKWYRLAAAQGYAAAQVNLGLMYGKGLGVAKDDLRAYMWFILAAGSGQAKAIQNRKTAAQYLTADQIALALQMARECQRRNFQDCDW